MVQAQGDVFVVVPVYGKGRVNERWIEGGGERNEPWNSSRETLLPGSVKATRKPGAIVKTCGDGRRVWQSVAFCNRK